MAGADVIAALRRIGTLDAIGPSAFRFDWSPILAPFEGQMRLDIDHVAESTVAYEGATWRWEFDACSLTTGRVLWRVANALRVLTVLTLLMDGKIISAWSADHNGTTIAADEESRRPQGMLITAKFAGLVAGSVGRLAFDAVATGFGAALDVEDESTRASERRSGLIASFVEDQLAAQPPISQEEIDALKRRLGLSP